MENNKENIIRFERVRDQDISGTGYLYGRFDIKSKHESDKEGYIGDFLSRMWTIFGEPEDIYEGFLYVLRHKDTGVLFTAGFTGSMGPFYGGFQEDVDRAKSVFEEFEALLGTVEPIDCEYEFGTDFGRFKVGAKDGIPYEMM